MSNFKEIAKGDAQIVKQLLLAVGSVPFAILTFVSSEIDPNISAIHVSQMVGVPSPFIGPVDGVEPHPTVPHMDLQPVAIMLQLSCAQPGSLGG
jgi:hypothetical protein